MYEYIKNRLSHFFADISLGPEGQGGGHIRGYEGYEVQRSHECVRRTSEANSHDETAKRGFKYKAKDRGESSSGEVP